MWAARWALIVFAQAPRKSRMGSPRRWNMPPDVKRFPAGKPVTFFYAVNQVGRVLPVQARWIGSDGKVATTVGRYEFVRVR